MGDSVSTPGVTTSRLAAGTCEKNFADLSPAFTGHEAAVAADRCYFSRSSVSTGNRSLLTCIRGSETSNYSV